MLRRCCLVGGSVVVSLALACSRGGPPVAELSFESTSLVLPYPAAVQADLAWTPLVGHSGLPRRAVVFVHLLDADGELVRTFDRSLESSGWVAGEPVRDRLELYQSVLGPPLRPGRYELTVGLYEPGGERYPLELPAPEVDELEYAVAAVEVPDDRPAVPGVEFEGAWSALDAGTDLQVVALRWLGGEATLVLAPVTAPVDVGMDLRLPSREGSEIVMEGEGEGELRLAVAGGCGAGSAGLIGGGLHEVVLHLEPPPEGEECRITLRPNFSLVDPSRRDRRSAALEVLTLTPASRGE